VRAKRRKKRGEDKKRIAFSAREKVCNWTSYCGYLKGERGKKEGRGGRGKREVD